MFEVVNMLILFFVQNGIRSFHIRFQWISIDANIDACTRRFIQMPIKLFGSLRILNSHWIFDQNTGRTDKENELIDEWLLQNFKSSVENVDRKKNLFFILNGHSLEKCWSCSAKKPQEVCCAKWKKKKNWNEKM